MQKIDRLHHAGQWKFARLFLVQLVVFLLGILLIVIGLFWSHSLTMRSYLSCNNMPVTVDGSKYQAILSYNEYSYMEQIVAINITLLDLVPPVEVGAFDVPSIEHSNIECTSVNRRLVMPSWDEYMWMRFSDKYVLISFPVVLAAIGSIIILGTIYPVGHVFRVIYRKSVWRRKGLCVSCGYDWSKAKSSVCPECGERVGDV